MCGCVRVCVRAWVRVRVHVRGCVVCVGASEHVCVRECAGCTCLCGACVAQCARGCGGAREGERGYITKQAHCKRARISSRREWVS